MPEQNDVLPIGEIEKRYDGEWVIVADPELNEMNEVLSGRVLAHSQDRDEAWRQFLAVTPRPTHIASLCFAKVPDDMVIIL
jgi:hypothetical protein